MSTNKHSVTASQVPPPPPSIAGSPRPSLLSAALHENTERSSTASTIDLTPRKDSLQGGTPAPSAGVVAAPREPHHHLDNQAVTFGYSTVEWPTTGPADTPAPSPDSWICVHKHLHHDMRPLTNLPQPPRWCTTCPVCTSPNRPDPESLHQRENLMESTSQRYKFLRGMQLGYGRRENDSFYAQEYARMLETTDRLKIGGRVSIAREYGRTVGKGGCARPREKQHGYLHHLE